MKPGEATLHWIHFGIAASSFLSVVAGFAGWIPGPIAVAGSAIGLASGPVKNYLLKKQADQEASM